MDVTLYFWYIWIYTKYIPRNNLNTVKWTLVCGCILGCHVGIMMSTHSCIFIFWFAFALLKLDFLLHQLLYFMCDESFTSCYPAWSTRLAGCICCLLFMTMFFLVLMLLSLAATISLAFSLLQEWMYCTSLVVLCTWTPVASARCKLVTCKFCNIFWKMAQQFLVWFQSGTEWLIKQQRFVRFHVLIPLICCHRW